MEIIFKTKNDKQLQASEYWVDDATEEILYGGAKGGGKSFLGASLIFGDGLIYPGTHYFIARQELTDLNSYTLPTIHEVFQKWGLDFSKYVSYNGQSHIFSLYNDSKVHFIACKETPADPMFERFGSMQMTRGWIEEAGEVAEAAKANLWLSIGRWKNDEYKLKKKMLITANPKKGWMKRDFVDPSKQGLLAPSRKYIQAFATDNKYLPEDYLNTLRGEKDIVRRQRLWEGSWDYEESKDSLISFDALTDTFSNTIIKDGQKYLIIDVARLGKDRTVFSFWDGLEMYRVEKFQQQDTEKTKQQARDFSAAEHIPYSNILIDADGIGGSVVDGMFGVKSFVANSRPLPTSTQIKLRQTKADHHLVPKTIFGNLKAQCGWKLAELINEHKIALKVPELRDTIIEEVTALLRDRNIDSDGARLLKEKDDVKKDLNGRSPDVGDTILMRVWFELNKASSIDEPERAVILGKQQQHFARNRNRIASRSNK